MVESKKRVLVPAGKPEPKNENSFITPRGKDIEVKLVNGFWIISFPAGGTIPKELSGRFTDKWRADKAVEVYLNTYWKGRS